jgi:rod shape-determining protein MreD
MRWFRFAALILVATILQTGLVDIIAVTKAGVKPDLLLILLVFFAVRCDPTDAVIASFTIGFAADLINPVMGLMGPRIISFGLAGTLLNDLQRILSLRRAVPLGVTIFLTGVLTAGLSHLLTLLRAESVAGSLRVGFLWQPLYSAVIGPFVSVPLGWWMHMNRKDQRRYGRRSPWR